jgi:hypothetical protein
LSNSETCARRALCSSGMELPRSFRYASEVDFASDDAPGEAGWTGERGVTGRCRGDGCTVGGAFAFHSCG